MAIIKNATLDDGAGRQLEGKGGDERGVVWSPLSLCLALSRPLSPLMRILIKPAAAALRPPRFIRAEKPGGQQHQGEEGASGRSFFIDGAEK